MGNPQRRGQMLEIHEMPGHLIRRLHQISISLFAENTGRAGFDLTAVQYAALVAIDAYPGLDQASLAGVIAYDRATIGGVVDRLVQKELVLRKTSARDRRARELVLTHLGKNVLTGVTPAVRRAQDPILSGLSQSEKQTFIELLRKTTEAGNAFSRAPLRPIKQPAED